MPNIPITVNQNPSGINITPTFANVPNGPANVVLQWNASGNAFFPNTNFFQWKNNPSGAPPVNFISSTQLQSDPYVNDGTGAVWSYKINVSGTFVDPEVNNESPGGPGDEDPGTGTANPTPNP
jgi:hypothetical protein